MIKFFKKASLILAGVVAVLGFSSNKATAAIDNMGKGPLYLEHGNYISSTLAADHSSHYSHSSHSSHHSHYSSH